jgi:hypothetical protein
MDGHGGQLMANYLKDHLLTNVATEWRYLVGEMEERRDSGKGKCDGKSSSSSSPSKETNDELGPRGSKNEGTAAVMIMMINDRQQ